MEKTFIFNVTEAEKEAIIAGLGELPAKLVFALIIKLRNMETESEQVKVVEEIKNKC